MEEVVNASVLAPINQDKALNDSAINTMPSPTGSKTEKCPGLGASADQVRVLDKSEYKEAAACLAEAFAEDEVAFYFINTPDRAQWSQEQKWNLHVHILECVVYAHCIAGLATTVGPDYAGVALWLPPGARLDGFFTAWRSGLALLAWKLSSEGRYRLFKEFFPLLHNTKHELLGERDKDSYYLVYVGTKKAARGKGYARKLVENQTKKADMEGRVTYLESSAAVNVAIYRKLGFEVAKKIYLRRAEKDIELDVMVREPKSSSSTVA